MAQAKWMQANDPTPPAYRNAVALVCSPADFNIVKDAINQGTGVPGATLASLMVPQHPPIWVSVHCLPGELFLPQTEEERDSLVDGSYWVKQLGGVNPGDRILVNSKGRDGSSFNNVEGIVIRVLDSGCSYDVNFSQFRNIPIHVRSIVRVVRRANWNTGII